MTMLKLSWFVIAAAAFSPAQNGAVHGVVLDPNGAAVPDAIISVQPTSGNGHARPVAITDAKGAFHIKQQPGNWKLCATAFGFALRCDTLDLVPSGSIDLKLTLAIGPLPNAISVHSTEDNPLELYSGQWTSTSRMYDTAFSKAQDIAAKLTCTWTVDNEFLVCDQLITMGGNTHSQLTVYSRDHERHTYVYSTFNEPGASPNFSELEVKGRQFSYNGRAEQDGRQTLFRTTNTFSPSGDHYDFVAEFSSDNGAHWTRMLEGKATRIAP